MENFFLIPKLKITESIEVVRHNTAMLRRVQDALVRRCELVVNQQGKHFERSVKEDNFLLIVE